MVKTMEGQAYSVRVMREKLRAEMNEKLRNCPASYPDGLHRLKLGKDGKLSQAQIEAYHTDGYLIIEGLVQPGELASLRDDCWGCWSGIKGEGEVHPTLLAALRVCPP